jgi:hypothetical protein
MRIFFSIRALHHYLTFMCIILVDATNKSDFVTSGDIVSQHRHTINLTRYITSSLQYYICTSSRVSSGSFMVRLIKWKAQQRPVTYFSAISQQVV